MWRTSRAEYLRGIMDAVSDPQVHTVVVMSGSQVGKTEFINNVAGFYIDQDPSPILVLQPTLEMAQTWSKDRLAPMLRDTPALRGRVQDPRSRDSGNTLLHKTFPGGHITVSGANSAASLASRPIRVVLCDEVDRYPVSAGTEGDPVTLASKRSTTFWNRKLILVSTPTIKGMSRIEAAYAESDQRKFHVSCPHCEHEQVMKWSQVDWISDVVAGEQKKHRPETASYICESCGCLWSDAERWRAVSRGKWRATGSFRGIAGFHLNEIYSPWVKMSETVTNFLDAKPSKERLQAWTNTALGDVWEERGEKASPSGLEQLMESYGPDSLPEDVLYATAGVDVQDDRLEVERVAWGADERSWGVQYEVIHGDPAQPGVWEDLDAVLLEDMKTETGRTIRLMSAAIDSQGHHTESVHRFCRDRFRRKIFAIKGRGGQGVPIWPAKSSKAVRNNTVFIVGVDTAKDMVYSRWRIPQGAEASCTLPANPMLGYDEKWRNGVTVEERMTRYREGRPYTVWVCRKGARNEPLDCRVYATAAMRALPRHLRSQQAAQADQTEANVTPALQPASGWMSQGSIL